MNTKNSPFSFDRANTKEAGLTLIELMLVMALSGLISIMIYQTLFSTLRIYRRGMDKSLLQNEVRGILRSIRNDLTHASQVSVYPQVPGIPEKHDKAADSSLQPPQPLTGEMKIVLGDKTTALDYESQNAYIADSRIVRYYLNPLSSKTYALFRMKGENKQLLSSRIDTLTLTLIETESEAKRGEPQDAERIKGMKFFIRLMSEDGKRKESYATTLLFGK